MEDGMRWGLLGRMVLVNAYIPRKAPIFIPLEPLTCHARAGYLTSFQSRTLLQLNQIHNQNIRHGSSPGRNYSWIWAVSAAGIYQPTRLSLSVSQVAVFLIKGRPSGLDLYLSKSPWGIL